MLVVLFVFAIVASCAKAQTSSEATRNEVGLVNRSYPAGSVPMSVDFSTALSATSTTTVEALHS